MRDGLVAGGVAGVASGGPSTLYALATGRDPLEATLAAGSLLLPSARRTSSLLAAALPVHLAMSVGWALVLAATLPRRGTTAAGAAAGLAIGGLDLGVIGRRIPRIRALPLGAQLADHVLYGALVGAVVAHRRSRRAGAREVAAPRRPARRARAEVSRGQRSAAPPTRCRPDR